MNKIDPTINTYNLYDDVYDKETEEFWENFPKSTIDIFVNELFGKKILDIGSGAGRDAIILRDRGLNITCIDAANKMVERTRKLGFTTIQSDFRKMDIENDKYDGAWAYTSLLHIKKEEVKDVLNNIYRTLKHKGVFLIGMIEGHYEGNKVRDSMPDTYRYFKFYDEKELRELVESVGFVFNAQEKYKPHTTVYISQIYTKP